ncbi:nucleotidyltransferase family protein [Tasmannia lanceolata]|uniref:nucleotidyltransferase family protein n=1 Tax=Tasmannia lanceolata TaxID=3420 RepID=UPI004062D0FC
MGEAEEETCFLYETLGLLSNSTDSEPINLSEQYSVIRNQISSSSVSHSPEIAPTDYFSLEFIEDSTPKPLLSTPSKPTPSRKDKTLERAWFRPNARFKSPMLQLHKEILDFCDFISPTQDEKASRAAAVQRVFEVIKYIWPNCRVEVFGSFKTGLYLPTSDIDVVVLESKVKAPQIGLQALSKALSQRSIAKKIQVIAKARVPIIKFVERQSGVAFDISFDVLNGPKAAEFIKDALNEIPPLKPLCLILKVFLQQRELNEVYSGGIGSYALLAMVMAHLQMHWRGQDSKGCKTSLEHNLGILLVKFFEFYGRKLNTCDIGVSCKAAGTFFLKSNKGFLQGPNRLCIEDPQAPDNDIGKNSYNYFQIRSAFSRAYTLLTDAKTIVGLGPNKSILGTIIRPDPLLLQRKGGRNGEITFDRLLPGAGEPLEQEPENEQEILCNWQLYEDEPLPRENRIDLDNGIHSSRKKKAPKGKLRAGETPDREVKKIRREEKTKETGSKKKCCWRGL